MCLVGVLVGLLLPLAGSPSRAADPASGFRWVDDPAAGTCDLMFGDQPILQYVHGTDTSTPEREFATSKVFHHVYGPGTGTRITNGPEGLYSHHRGMFVGWSKTSFDGRTENFWSCRGETQRHGEFLERTADAERAGMTARIAWNDRQGQLVLEERRAVEVRLLPTDSPPGFGWLMDWSSTLTSRRGTVQLDGDRQHAGFQFRAASPVAESNGARFLRPAAFPQQPEAVQVNDRTDPDAYTDLGWLAMRFELQGQAYTVEYHEAAEVPRPSRYSERPYGRFGAFFPVVLEEGRPFTMRYQVVVTRGDPPSLEAIESRHREFQDRLSGKRS